MAYVESFEQDVFISYAHADNQPLPGVAVGWVTELAEGVRIGLGYEGLRDHRVWMDGALAGNLDLTDQLTAALDGSATLVVVLSRAYLTSDWCAREKDSFLEMVAARRRSGSRVFVVERDHLTEERPRAFEGLIGYHFWAKDPERQRAKPLSARENPAAYHDALAQLCFDLSNELRELNTPQALQRQVDRVREQPTVYLAEVTDDIDGKREDVRRFLQQAGIRTLPEELYPLSPEQFREAAAADIERADAVVQLLSPIPGKRGFVRLQHEIAVTSGKPFLQWRSPDLDVLAVESEEHRSLLSGSTVRAEGFETFKRMVIELVRQRPEAETETETETNRPAALVFVNMDAHDHDLGKSLCAVLRARGVGFSLPLTEGTPAEIREDLEQNLQQCDAVIVVYGLATIRWVRSQLLQHRRILAKRKDNLRAFAVFKGRAQDKVDLELDIPGIDFVQVGPDDLEARVEDFVRVLEGYDDD